MSLRIHRAIGWGMPREAFLVSARRPLGTDADEALHDLFAALEDERTCVPEGYAGLGPGSDDEGPVRGPRIVQRRLLATRLRLGGRGVVADEPGEGGELYVPVSDVDGGNAHLLFMPNAGYGRRWHRVDDDLDWAFARHDAEGRLAGPAATSVRYVDLGHHPYRARMTADGLPARLGTPGSLPAVPDEVRWLLVHATGLLDDAGATRLRPAIAEWWG